MEITITLILFIHLIGMALLVGGSFSQIKAKERRVLPLMRDGALTQLITGIILSILVYANGEKLMDSIAGIKFTIIFAILIIMYVGRKKLSNGQYFTVLSLSVAEVALALFIHASN